MRRIFLLILVLLNVQCIFHKPALTTDPKESLVSKIQQLVDDPLLANAHLGIIIESLSDSSIIFQYNPNKLFLPASNQKLYTTATALELLGPDYRFLTQFFRTGEVQDSVLNGDLIVKGRGDPSISGRFYNDDPLFLLSNWADLLLSKGINTINGDLLGDESYFKDYRLGKAWNWDDEPYYYSAQISALSFNENCVKLFLSSSGDLGDSVLVELSPPTDYVNINNSVKVVNQDSLSNVKVWRTRAQNIIELKGGLLKGLKDTISVTVENPAFWFVTNFAEVLKSRGININGDLKTLSFPDSSTGNDEKLLFSHYSPTLLEIVTETNKESNNFYAEQLLKTQGAEIGGEGTAVSGEKVIKDWLADIGVNEKFFYTVDGSGLSRMNLVSPNATAALLGWMYYSKYFQEFYQSLPVAGKDGTLKNRMKGSAAEGVLKAKTGFLTHVRNLAGYTKDKAGNDYIFVIMVNNYTVKTSYINEFQNKIGILLSTYNPSVAN